LDNLHAKASRAIELKPTIAIRHVTWQFARYRPEQLDEEVAAPGIGFESRLEFCPPPLIGHCGQHQNAALLQITLHLRAHRLEIVGDFGEENRRHPFHRSAESIDKRIRLGELEVCGSSGHGSEMAMNVTGKIIYSTEVLDLVAMRRRLGEGPHLVGAIAIPEPVIWPAGQVGN
jgi:hypothetical protein